LLAAFPNLAASVAAGGMLILNGSQHLASLTLVNGATAIIADGGTLTLDNLSIPTVGTARLDIGAGYIILNYAAGQGAAALAQHYNQAANWSTADFNYDGTVTFTDLVALAQRYNQTLPADPVGAFEVLSPAITVTDTRNPSLLTLASPAGVVTSTPVRSST